MSSKPKKTGQREVSDFKDVKNRKIRDNAIKRKQKKGQKCPDSADNLRAQYARITAEEAARFQSFDAFPLSRRTIDGLRDAGFTKPTDIQRQTIYLSITGNDVVGAAKTGSGKTLALLIPVLECLWKNKWSRDDGLGALIITPTRELAVQIFQVLNQIGAHHDFSAGVLIGGTDVAFEKKRLATVNIVIATPGRLLQHMDENETFSCDLCQILVVDEADRILDMGFTRQINSIIENLPRERQTLLFSATQTRNVKDLARICTNDPLFVSVHEHAQNATPDQLLQSYFVCNEEEKVNILWSYLVNHKRKKTLIFVTTCKQARFLTEALSTLKPGLSLMGLWGTQNQTRRIEVFEEFSQAKAAALIATDVASRGLDFDGVDYVLQLDCAASVDDYIHRVGRTARMNKKGEAVLVLTPSQEEPFIQKLAAKNITVNKIHVDPKQITDIRIKLSSTLSSTPDYRAFAQFAVVAYAKAIHTAKLRDVFDVKKIDFHALALSYGLAIAPRIRFLRKQGIDVTKNNVKAEKSEDDEETEKPSKSKLIKPEPAAFSIDEDDDVIHVARKNIFNVKPEEFELLDEDLKPQSKKKQKQLNKEQQVKKLLKRGALLNVKKIIFDDDGNPIEDTSALRKFDIAEAEDHLEKSKKEDQMKHKAMLKEIRQEKKRKQKERELKARGVDKVDDFAESGDSDGGESVDLSWLPDPDKKGSDHDEDDNSSFKPSDDEEERAPPAKKRKLPTKKSIQDAEAQALALLGLH
uniref:ATP-dependent RNA helicase n=1 Tax=Panagrellus redivivus TaxID=6233 RepID=A0A7E4VDF4_PANRE